MNDYNIGFFFMKKNNELLIYFSIGIRKSRRQFTRGLYFLCIDSIDLIIRSRQSEYIIVSIGLRGKTRERRKRFGMKKMCLDILSNNNVVKPNFFGPFHFHLQFIIILALKCWKFFTTCKYGSMVSIIKFSFSIASTATRMFRLKRQFFCAYYFFKHVFWML